MQQRAAGTRRPSHFPHGRAHRRDRRHRSRRLARRPRAGRARRPPTPRRARRRPRAATRRRRGARGPRRLRRRRGNARRARGRRRAVPHPRRRGSRSHRPAPDRRGRRGRGRRGPHRLPLVRRRRAGLDVHARARPLGDGGAHPRDRGAVHVPAHEPLHGLHPVDGAPEGVIRGPAGDGRLAAILRDDVAAAAVEVLTSDGHDGRSYDLTGREAFSLAEAAALMSEHAARRSRSRTRPRRRPTPRAPGSARRTGRCAAG